MLTYFDLSFLDRFASDDELTVALITSTIRTVFACIPNMYISIAN